MNEDTWRKYKYFNVSSTKGFASDDFSQVQIIQMYNTSDTMWSLSLPHIETIKSRLINYSTSTDDIFLSFKYSFNRPVYINFNKIVTSRSTKFNQKNRLSFILRK